MPAVVKHIVKKSPYLVLAGIAGVISVPPESIPNGDDLIISFIARTLLELVEHRSTLKKRALSAMKKQTDAATFMELNILANQ